MASYIESSLAKKVAEGDVCPVTLLPMEDINPTFVPRTARKTKDAILSKGVCKMMESDNGATTSILKFFSTSSIPMVYLDKI